jgi:hypothetical protein
LNPQFVTDNIPVMCWRWTKREVRYYVIVVRILHTLHAKIKVEMLRESIYINKNVNVTLFLIG